MAAITFAVTPEAIAFILEEIRLAPLRGLTEGPYPLLSYCLSSWSGNLETREAAEHIPYAHFDVGWFRPQQLTDYGTFEIQLHYIGLV